MAVRDRSQSVEALPDEWETKSAEALLAWALGEFHPRIALAASFGAEDVVLIDMLVKLDPRARVFTLDTGRLPAETYSLMETIRARYGLAIEVYFPQADAVEAMVREHGVNLFYTSIDSRKLCCGVRKVEPLSRALRGLDAWITGLRREQAVTRAQVRKVGVDAEHGGLIKLNPLADWTEDQVWAYIRAHTVPYNTLHDRGYPSIGCAPCTRAVAPGEDPRAGRWWWESADTKECGLHVTKR
ncbi:MAG: phosphoadenosine phosphosulfate reductase [Candidatus Rokubacteria bacterium 13_1_40CM_69_27]|nr:MAG: phosphoadenosine phosphosulfate reductase [Candidatus Rokubacteria bacterium 13_1_40CM_69_27]OLC35129.1 MAG: phosphoadenosine phosphosulfate reductase [Candidatus Rokubacteria bacterium 13_1_40CM_4_69_5]